MTPALDRLRADYRGRLGLLRDHHIFQWTTHYADSLTNLLRLSLSTSKSIEAIDPIAALVRDELRTHANEIYEKGYQHVTQRLGLSGQDARAKSLAGLRGFLSVPPKAYSDLILDVSNAEDAVRLRHIVSAILSGILDGHATSRLGDVDGASALAIDLRPWFSYLGFLTADDLRLIVSRFRVGERTPPAGLETIVLPVVAALDRLINPASPRLFCLPIVSEHYPRPARLELSLQLPPWAERKRFIDIHCHLEPSSVTPRVASDALGRGIDLLAASLNDELYSWWQEQDIPSPAILDAKQVAPSLADHEDSVTERAHAILEQALLDNVGEDSSQYVPLVRNYPADFPLENPLRRRFVLVQRTSVTRLLALFERETGAHLWCSVRRSGKTTACRDLGASAGHTLIVNQTTQTDALEPDLNIFYTRITDAIANGRPLPADFFATAVRDCAVALGSLPTDNAKLVFILDEYEALFGLLQAVAERDAYLRFIVVYPLLSQMASFSHDHLLILLGQRPNAHFILSDHNQLSPLVRQDAFPLFEHTVGSPDSEFALFLQRVISERVSCDAAFTEILFNETAGHPYLTVNLMIEFFDWLIENRRKSRGLQLTDEDFRRFRRERLNPTALRRSTAYGFMQSLISDALSERKRRDDPWLYAVIVAMRRIATRYARTLRCSEPEFFLLIEDVASSFGWTASDLLRTAQMGNFLRFRDGDVGPAIPLLGRLAAITGPDI